MKRILTLILCLTMFVGVISGCAKKNKTTTASPSASQSSKVTAKSTVGQTTTPTVSQSAAVTATATKSPNTTTVVDNSTIFMIDNFNNMPDPLTGMKPMDLSAYGIQTPSMTVSSENAEEGSALTVPLNASTWCQAFDIDDTTRISSFTSKVTSKYYFRMYVSNQSQISIGFTISFKDGTNRSFLDSTIAVLTDTAGNVMENQTSNATSTAGEGSALMIPSDFTG